MDMQLIKEEVTARDLQFVLMNCALGGVFPLRACSPIRLVSKVTRGEIGQRGDEIVQELKGFTKAIESSLRTLNNEHELIVKFLYKIKNAHHSNLYYHKLLEIKRKNTVLLTEVNIGKTLLDLTNSLVPPAGEVKSNNQFQLLEVQHGEMMLYYVLTTIVLISELMDCCIDTANLVITQLRLKFYLTVMTTILSMVSSICKQAEKILQECCTLYNQIIYLKPHVAQLENKSSALSNVLTQFKDIFAEFPESLDMMKIRKTQFTEPPMVSIIQESALPKKRMNDSSSVPHPSPQIAKKQKITNESNSNNIRKAQQELPLQTPVLSQGKSKLNVQLQSKTHNKKEGQSAISSKSKQPPKVKDIMTSLLPSLKKKKFK